MTSGESHASRDLGLVLLAAGLGALGGLIARPGVRWWWWYAIFAACAVGGLLLWLSSSWRTWRARRTLLRGTRGWKALAVTGPGLNEHAVVLWLIPPKDRGGAKSGSIRCAVQVPTGEWVDVEMQVQEPDPKVPFYRTSFPTAFGFERARVDRHMPAGRLRARWYRRRTSGDQTLATKRFKLKRDGTFKARMTEPLPPRPALPIDD